MSSGGGSCVGGGGWSGALREKAERGEAAVGSDGCKLAATGTGKLPCAADGVVGGCSGSNYVADDWQVTAVAYYPTKKCKKQEIVEKQSKKHQSCADEQFVHGEEALKIEVAQLKEEILRLKTEKRVMHKMHLAERRARDRKELAFLCVFAGIILVAVTAILGFR